MKNLENYFSKYRENIIGYGQLHETVFGEKPLIYADWIASGRLYAPIEKILSENIGPFIANTHTESSTTGTLMTEAYHEARKIIKRHVNASEEDVLLTPGFGMTAAVVKLQRIMGLKICGKLNGRDCLDKSERPIVFITHMEHHSNHTSWYETIADVEIIKPGKNLSVDPQNLIEALEKYKDRKLKIGSFTACSNVTGIHTPYYELAKIMHQNGGLCFVDFAANAPYEKIDMHPSDPLMTLDAIFFSPHKFLGGPGSSGVLVFNKKLYNSKSPDLPGGGTVEWTNPWGEYEYHKDIEAREDGGTPGFMQAIRTALSILLKEQMNPDYIIKREKELLDMAFNKLEKIPNLVILAGETKNRLGIISFYIKNLHYNLAVKLLSDHYGIQVRGGCACAGTYGHYLLDVTHEKSHLITAKINEGDLSEKPGWVRLSLHPVMTNDEMNYILNAIEDVSKNHEYYAKEYTYNKFKNEFYHHNISYLQNSFINNIFKI